MEIYRFIFNRLEENTMVVCGEPGRCVVVDPGYRSDEERDALEGCLEKHSLKPEAVLLTHGHMDHIFGVADFQKRHGVPVYMAPEERSVVDYYQRVTKFGLPAADPGFTTTDISDDSLIEAAGLSFRVITTPGHSPGGVCYLEEAQKAIFTGDTLFAGAIGRTDLYEGDYDALIKSIMEKLMPLDGDIEIFPGHGGPSSIGTERATNPFLEPFNEREEIPELNETEANDKD